MSITEVTKDTHLWSLMSVVAFFAFPITGIVAVIMMHNARLVLIRREPDCEDKLYSAKLWTVYSFLICIAIYLMVAFFVAIYFLKNYSF